MSSSRGVRKAGLNTEKLRYVRLIYYKSKADGIKENLASVCFFTVFIKLYSILLKAYSPLLIKSCSVLLIKAYSPLIIKSYGALFLKIYSSSLIMSQRVFPRKYYSTLPRKSLSLVLPAKGDAVFSSFTEKISEGVPSAVTSPSSINSTRSATSLAKPIS